MTATDTLQKKVFKSESAMDFDKKLDEARGLLSFTHENFGSESVIAASFQDCVVIDLAYSQGLKFEVIFIDTGFHFAETLQYVDLVRRRYNLNLTVLSPKASEIPRCSESGCCQARKVVPMDSYLKHNRYRAWVTGIKQVDTEFRKQAKTVEWDKKRGMVKINPIFNWDESDVEIYTKFRNLPVHPLRSLGYLSIGCQPTTRPVKSGEDPRAGRFVGLSKTECGLHLS